MTPKVSIIIINYNSFEDTNDCLNSLADCNYKNFDVWIVDNGSSDNSINKIKKAFPQHNYVLSVENIGFSRGCNLGAKDALEAGADYLLMLNNDTIVDPNFLNPMIDLAERKENVGLVGGKSYFYEIKDVLWDAGGKALLHKGNCTRIGGKEKDTGQFEDERKVDFVTGCLMLIPKRTALVVGLLPDCYFFGVEEWDYGLMVRRNGLELWITPQAKIWHKVGGTHSDVDPVFYYNFIRGRLLFMRRNANRIYYWVWLVLFYFYSRFVKLYRHREILTQKRILSRATKAAFRDHFRYNSIKKEHLDALKVRM